MLLSSYTDRDFESLYVNVNIPPTGNYGRWKKYVIVAIDEDMRFVKHDELVWSVRFFFLAAFLVRFHGRSLCVAIGKQLQVPAL